MRIKVLNKKKLYIDKDGPFLPINESILSQYLMLEFIVSNRPKHYFISTIHAKEVISKFTFMNGTKVGLIPLGATVLDLEKHNCQTDEVDLMRTLAKSNHN